MGEKLISEGSINVSLEDGKFVRVRIDSFFGEGPGLQYIGIDMMKGIDMGIRGNIFFFFIFSISY